ncbi:MAG: replication initiation protein [Turicibacter sp.]|nr:replication initiation protein [Turicibacter sp.]
MNSDERIDILKSRDYIVSKSNQIVQKSRYNFTVSEQRTIAYICSKIKPIEARDRVKGTSFQLDYEFNILDYARTCGIQDNGRVYDDCKAILKGLRDKSMWLTLPDDSETTVGWLSKVTTNKRSGIVKIKIDEDLVPYLFDLQSKFLSYGLKNILNMKSQYSIRLYELLKSHHCMKVGQTDRRSFSEKSKNPKKTCWTIDLDELKKLLMVDTIKSYSNFNLFKTKVLEIAQKEVNELTDITFYVEPITKGRKTIKVKFTIVSKNMIERMYANAQNDELLGELG